MQSLLLPGLQGMPTTVVSPHSFGQGSGFFFATINSQLYDAYVEQDILEVKNKFDNSGVTFKAVDFVLEPPKKEGEPMMSDEQISIKNFYYSDIYEDGLVERVKKANSKD